MNKFPIDRLTVTVELVASRLARSDWMGQAVDRHIVHAQAEGDVARARRGDQDTLLVSPPMKKLLILASSWPSAARRCSGLR